ncbi:hypothetical protein CSUB01_04167 [Colletotrichum sublineola]|uniref:Uncharacterized protein n=1 Tax=Colletotrichum sublineola TaxID=1173701 RepID=A0A066WXF8_COLSU|nr:hypothetical protein CSUB01_04167 [Colletotrichum sublineola]
MRGRRASLHQPVPYDYDAANDVDRRRPKFRVGPCTLGDSWPASAANQQASCWANTRQDVRAVGRRGVSGAWSGRPLALRLTNLGLVAHGFVQKVFAQSAVFNTCARFFTNGHETRRLSEALDSITKP